MSVLGNRFPTEFLGRLGPESFPGLISGTPVATKSGAVPIEYLRPGDRVLTLNHGFQPVLRVGQRKFDATHECPVSIPKGHFNGVHAELQVILSPSVQLLRESQCPDTSEIRSRPCLAGELATSAPVRPEFLQKSSYVFLTFEREQTVNISGLWIECPILDESLRSSESLIPFANTDQSWALPASGRCVA